jgi:hypothetical protein
MKKVLFLMLFLMIFGMANVKAQVRIGGNGVPHGAAVLDLNADDTNNGTKTLALPRVRLVSTADKMGNATLLSGMLVYNTAGETLSEGVYYWDGSQWIKPNSTAYTESASITLSGTEIRRAALTGDVSADENSNVTTIADGAVTAQKLNRMGAEIGYVLRWDGSAWTPEYPLGVWQMDLQLNPDGTMLPGGYVDWNPLNMEIPTELIHNCMFFPVSRPSVTVRVPLGAISHRTFALDGIQGILRVRAYCPY